MQDPRSKNKFPEGKKLSDYLANYTKSLSDTVTQIPQEKLELAYSIIKKANLENANIYVAGNGGSSAIAGHLCCDWIKGVYLPSHPTLKVQSLTDNTALLTAIANDFSFEESFSAQLKMLAKKGDVLILISSSGNSPNVVKAAEVAKELQMSTIAFTGFSGGKLQNLADVCLHAAIENYGIAEDAHQLLMHVFAQFLYLERI
jgi:phosphoheptose isomerase